MIWLLIKLHFGRLQFIVDGDKIVRYLPLQAVFSEDKKNTKYLVDSSAYDEREVTLND